MDDFLGDVYFDDEKGNDVDWRKSSYDPGEDNDEELDETPEDVMQILGFDPKEFSVEKKVLGLSAVFKGGPGSGSWEGPGDPRVSSEDISSARNTVLEFAQHQTGSTEMAVYIANGKSVSVLGVDNKVGFTKEQIGEMQYMVHNHPNSASFSCTDVALFLGTGNLDQIDAVGKDGTLYSLTKESLSAQDLLLQVEEHSTSKFVRKTCGDWKKIEENTKEEFQSAVDKGDSPEEGWKEQTHKIMESLAKKNGLKYQRFQGKYSGKKSLLAKKPLVLDAKEDEKIYVWFDDSDIADNPYLKDKDKGLKNE